MNIAFETANPRLQNILSRLKGVKKVGPNTYRAYSPLRDEKEPSLYITEKSDGTILMCDHGGGDTKATLAAIGLTMCILFPSGGSEGSGPKGPAPSRKVAAIYKYLDKNGELVAEKVRYTNKNFFWRSKKPDGSYDYHKPENVPLYNGMVLEKAEAVFLVEGEKDVDTLTKHGLPAVSLPNGAHWENEYVAYFSDKVIIILPDNDDAGRGYAKAALKALKPTNYNAGIMQLNNWWPEIPEKGDVTDYITAKGEEAVAKLREALDVVTRNRKPAPAVPAVPTAQCSTAAVTVAATSAPVMLKTCNDYHNVIKKLNPYSNPKYSTTDNGSGRLFSDIVKGQARYVASRKSWFIYDGTRWAPDEGNMATMEMCKTIGDALTRYAFEIKDEKERKEDVKPFLLYRVEKEPTMERRKDKNNHVLKDGESYREKEHRYMYRWVDSDKKRHCTYAQTLRELRKKEAEINRNKSDGISSAGSNLRLDDVYNLWKKNKVGLKQSTYVNYLYMYEHFIGPKIGKMKIKDIRKSTVLGLYNDLTRSNDIGKTMAINTLEVIHNVLRQVLQVAVDDDYIRKNPTEGVLREVKKANNYERPKRKALTLEQQNAFIRFLKSKPLYYSWSILFAVLLGTGCRIAEFIGLRWCDIDWKNNTISINHNLVYRQHTDGKCYFSVTTPKTSAGCRTIPMMKDVRRALEDEKIRQQELGVRCTTVIDGYTDFAFFNRFGQPHNPAAINREIDRLVLAYNAQEMEKAAEENRTPVILPDFSCHQLRHTFCTRYCEIEPNIKVIQEVMGHKDIKTTMEIYAEAQKELKERSVQNISGKFDVY